MKIRIKYIVIIIVILLIAWYLLVKPFLKNPIEGFITEEISKGDIVQEISETGNVKATDDFNLGFKTTGKVSRLYVGVGDIVARGDTLVQLDAGQILAQLQSAQSALNYTSSQYDSAVAVAQDNLQSAYNSAQNTLDDAYTKIYNAYNAVIDLVNTYFNTADQEGIKVSEAKVDIQRNMQEVKSYLNTDNIPKILINLNNVYKNLQIVRDQCDIGIYYSKISSTYKTSIDTQKTNINTALTNVTSDQTSINSYKIALQKAQDNTIEQAQANVDLYQSQLQDTYLRSPTDGIITRVDVKRGETISAGQSAVTLLSDNPFQIKVNIYEQDIVKVKIGDPVKINLVALPKQTFQGKVLLIDPAETIVDNVVYYQVTIDFPNQPEGIKSGMTVDVVVETNRKTNVLRIPKNAVQIFNGKDTVQIVKDNKIENREITTGIEGNDYYEVLSGISEGDTIITGKK